MLTLRHVFEGPHNDLRCLRITEPVQPAVDAPGGHLTHSISSYARTPHVRGMLFWEQKRVGDQCTHAGVRGGAVYMDFEKLVYPVRSHSLP